MVDLAVIMSVYQNDKLDYIIRSVQSILNQTYSNFDFFICFDGPVLFEIDRYISTLNDSRIKKYSIERNFGLAKALNFLLEKVLLSADYRMIARMDADDISIATRLETQRNFFLNNPTISCIGSWYQEIDESNRILSYQKLPTTHDEILKFFLKRTPFAHPSVMFRKEMIEKVGFYPTNTLRMEDQAFWHNAAKNGLLFANIPEFLLLFRRDKGFYGRRTGIRFGFNFIRTKFKIIRTLKAPKYIYIYTFFIGLIRMMPAFVLKYIYLKYRDFYLGDRH